MSLFQSFSSFFNNNSSHSADSNGQQPPEPESAPPEAPSEKDSFNATALKVGSFLSSFGSKIKHGMEGVADLSLLGDFNREQQEFVRKKNAVGMEPALPPWVGCRDEESVKEQVLALSQDTRNFTRAPPPGTDAGIEVAHYALMAQATMEADPSLKQRRFDLVPKQVNEEQFWTNYFYRVNLIKQRDEMDAPASPLTIEQQALNNINHKNDTNKSSSSSHNNEGRRGVQSKNSANIIDELKQDGATSSHKDTPSSTPTGSNMNPQGTSNQQVSDSNQNTTTKSLSNQLPQGTTQKPQIQFVDEEDDEPSHEYSDDPLADTEELMAARSLSVTLNELDAQSSTLQRGSTETKANNEMKTKDQSEEHNKKNPSQVPLDSPAQWEKDLEAEFGVDLVTFFGKKKNSFLKRSILNYNLKCNISKQRVEGPALSDKELKDWEHEIDDLLSEN